VTVHGVPKRWTRLKRLSKHAHCFLRHNVITHLMNTVSDLWLSEQEQAEGIEGKQSSPGEENGNPLQYSCLENPMDRGAWQASVHGVTRVGHDLATKPPNHHSQKHKFPVLR
ncbi:hypothetical protein FD755_004429, partial [Muntiacus reevesi]